MAEYMWNQQWWSFWIVEVRRQLAFTNMHPTNQYRQHNGTYGRAWLFQICSCWVTQMPTDARKEKEKKLPLYPIWHGSKGFLSQIVNECSKLAIIFKFYTTTPTQKKFMVFWRKNARTPLWQLQGTVECHVSLAVEEGQQLLWGWKTCSCSEVE